jgi:Flp pilus assembly protein TadG
MTNYSYQKGSVLVESAITLLIVLLFLIGIMEGGLLIWSYNTVAFAAREGTRYATVRGADSSSPASASTISTYVKAQAVGLDPNLMTVTTTWNPSNSPGGFVQVVVQYQYSTLTSLFVSAPIALTSTSKTVVLH